MCVPDLHALRTLPGGASARITVPQPRLTVALELLLQGQLLPHPPHIAMSLSTDRTHAHSRLPLTEDSPTRSRRRSALDDEEAVAVLPHCGSHGSSGGGHVVPYDSAIEISAAPTAPAVAASSSSSSPVSLDRVSVRHDLLLLVRLALPSSAIFLVQFAINFSSIIFIGQLGPEYLGAAALANMLANLTGFSIGQGAATALDALCSQAYGAKSFQLVGRHTQRGMLILSIACVPVAAVWWRTDTILGWMGVESVICELAGRYTRLLIPGLWPTLMFECMRRYLQAQSILWPIVVSAVVGAICSLALNFSQ